MKTCTVCGKPVEGNLYPSDEKRHNYRCKDCNRTHRRERGRRKWQRLMLPFLLQPCADCGKTYHPAVMEFDHIEPKSASVGSMNAASDAAILAEIAKCDVVCGNCHNIRTYTRSGTILWMDELMEEYLASQSGG